MIASFDPFGSKEKSITGSIIQHRRDSVIKCSNMRHCIIIFKAFKLLIHTVQCVLIQDLHSISLYMYVARLK